MWDDRRAQGGLTMCAGQGKEQKSDSSHSLERNWCGDRFNRFADKADGGGGPACALADPDELT